MQRSVSRLAAVMQRKLAMCQGTNGRICFASQRNSFGIFRDRTTSHLYLADSERQFGGRKMTPRIHARGCSIWNSGRTNWRH